MNKTKTMLDVQYTEICKQIGDAEMRIQLLKNEKKKLLEQADKVAGLASAVERQEALAAQREAALAKQAANKKLEAVNGQEETKTPKAD